MHRKSGQPVGTVRLVLPLADVPERSFSIQTVTEEPVIKNATAFPLLATAEISRFCIERQFRRRRTDTLYDQEGIEPTVSENPAERRSRVSWAAATLHRRHCPDAGWPKAGTAGFLGRHHLRRRLCSLNFQRQVVTAKV
jgi:N-acyl amino acid synthase of PEP-CTERM/exosortase system